MQRRLASKLLQMIIQQDIKMSLIRKSRVVAQQALENTAVWSPLNEEPRSSSCTLARGAGSEYHGEYSGALFITVAPGRGFHAGATNCCIGWLVIVADKGGVEDSESELFFELFELL